MLIERNKGMSETKDEQGTETQETEDKLGEQHFLTLQGSGGYGKTSLAKQYMERELADIEQIRNELNNRPKDLNSIASTIMDLMKRFDPLLIAEAIHEVKKDAIFQHSEDAILSAKALQQAHDALSVLRNAVLGGQQFDAAGRPLHKAEQTLMPQPDNPTIIHFRIIEEPLTSQNLALAFTTLTELATKFWLIAKRRLPELIEYTQTHDIRFANEAGSTITWVTYNSPFSFGFQVDKLVPSVAESLMTVVDGLSQRKAKREKLELDNQEAAQKIKEDKQKTELDQAREQLTIERERVALLRETMEVQKQGIEYALEIADKLVDKLHPGVDPETKGMIVRTLLPGILQLDNVRGLQLVLPENDIKFGGG
jgi:hypothetical protein